MSFKKQVVFTTSPKQYPASSQNCFNVFHYLYSLYGISLSTALPVEGLTGICPETNKNGPATTACEYGPIAWGAFFVEIFFIPFLLSNEIFFIFFYYITELYLSQYIFYKFNYCFFAFFVVFYF